MRNARGVWHGGLSSRLRGRSRGRSQRLIGTGEIGCEQASEQHKGREHYCNKSKRAEYRVVHAYVTQTTPS